MLADRAEIQHHGQVAITTGLSLAACQFFRTLDSSHSRVFDCVLWRMCVYVCEEGCKQVNNNNHKSIPVPIPRGQVLKTV